MVAAIVFGATAATFAIGVGASLTQVQAAKNHDNADVIVPTFAPQSGHGPVARNRGPRTPTSADPAAITAAVNAQTGTRAYYGTAETEVSVAGVTGSTTVFAFTGNASWAGYRMISGSWFHGPGQAVVPTTFLTATGARVGDTVTLEDHGKAVPVRIVGEVFDPHTQTMEVLTDAGTLAAAEPNLHPDTYSIAVKPGTEVRGYIHKLDTALRPLGVSAQSDQFQGKSDAILALDALTAILTLMLVATAGLGVLNAVVLDTRERIHDLGVHKALGMTPRQAVTMVIASVVVIGLIGGATGVPVGAALQATIVPAMGHSAGINMPASVIDVYHPTELVLLGFGGLLIAVLGAFLPAGWAARTRTATALRTE
jgi:putative ABC transport system permease protein